MTRANDSSMIALVAMVVLGCTSNQPGGPAPVAVNTKPTPATPAPVTPATPATPVTPATPATPVTPATPSAPVTPATPTTPPEPAPTELTDKPPPPAAGSCELSGTWRLKIVSGEDGCGDFESEHIDLALATVAPKNTIASAARSFGKAGPFGATLPDLRVAPYTGPGVTCGLRVRLGTAPAPHVELLLQREGDGLHGQGSLWSTRDGAPCRHGTSVFGEYIAAQPQPWSALTSAGPWPRPPAAKPASSELEAAARNITARSIFGGTPASRPRVKLRGSIVDYVAAVVETPRSVKLHQVPCTAIDEPRCVAIEGDPCRPGQHEGEDCEGMYLTVVIAPNSGNLDRVDAGGYPVETQANIEQRLEDAP